MLLTHEYFGTFTSKRISDAQQSCEVLLALSRDSREEVDAITKAAAATGGKADVRPPQDMSRLTTFSPQNRHAPGAATAWTAKLVRRLCQG